MFPKKIILRKSNRWQFGDYTDGAYMVTVCVEGRKNAFGGIRNGIMCVNRYGSIVYRQWKWLGQQYDIRLDAFVVMPNHVHGIIGVYGDARRQVVATGLDLSYGGTSLREQRVNPHRCTDQMTGRDLSLPGLGLSQVIGAFKTTSSKWIHRAGLQDFVWQRSFHDRIIRNNDEYDVMREYVLLNPSRWAEDAENIR